MNKLTHQIAKGATWMVALRLCVKSISIVSTMILARLLTPNDFGLMALVSSTYAVVDLFKSFSFDMALIQNQKTENEYYDTAWTLNILASAILSAILIIAAHPISNFYNDTRLTEALYVISLTIFIDGLNNIGIINFRKDFQFNKEFKYQLFVKASGFITTIPLALYLHNYWALLIGMLFSTITSVFLSYAMQPYRPKLGLKRKKELAAFCSWLYINNFLQVVNKNSQSFILGKLSGSRRLGIFSLADDISNIATTEIIAPINRASYPGYSKLADNPYALKQIYLKTIAFITIVSLPCSIGIALLAPLFVNLLLGDQWNETIPVIQILALSSAADSLNTNSTYIYITLNKQYVITRLLCLKSIILIPLLVIMTQRLDLIGAAYASLCTSLILLPLNIRKISLSLDISWKEYLCLLYRPIVAALIMAVILNEIITRTASFTTTNTFISLIALTTLGAFIFITILILSWKITGNNDDIEYTALRFVQEKLKRY